MKMKLASMDSNQVEAGSTLTLLVPLMFGQEGALFFQDAQLLSAAELSPTLPYCRMTPGSAATPLTVQPGPFPVRSVDYDDRAGATGGQTPSVTRIQLAANPQQPYDLACQWPQGGPSTAFLTPQEIQGAIGAHFKMALQK